MYLEVKITNDNDNSGEIIAFTNRALIEGNPDAPITDKFYTTLRDIIIDLINKEHPQCKWDEHTKKELKIIFGL